jgi:hypothetical protein
MKCFLPVFSLLAVRLKRINPALGQYALVTGVSSSGVDQQRFDKGNNARPLSCPRAGSQEANHEAVHL